MATIKKNIGYVPVNAGEYTTGKKYGKYNLVSLYGCVFISLASENNTAPAAVNEAGEIVLNNEKWDFFVDNREGYRYNNKKQDIVEESLETESKEIPAAINEIHKISSGIAGMLDFPGASALEAPLNVDGKYRLQSTGTLVTSSDYATYGPVALKQGDVICGLHAGISNVAILSEVTESGDWIRSMIIGVGEAAPYRFVAPSDMYIEICCTKESSGGDVIYTGSVLNELLVSVQKTDSLLLGESAYAVAGWNPDELDPQAIEFHGDMNFLKKWEFYLLDTTDNSGQTTKAVGKLKRNNLLRFADGRFAPTVGITEEMKAECDVALYLDPEHTRQYCSAGEFDPAAFYENYGMTQQLYDSAGKSVRILRPWETTETKYTIGIGRNDTIYLLDNVIGKSGKAWKGIFSRPQYWDGIDVSLYPLAPTAISPGPVCTVDNKTRNFFFLYEGETNCKSSNGENDLCTLFNNGRTYPRTSDMNQLNNMTRARANNSDPDKSYPFAEGGYHALNAFITSLEVLWKTKYIHAPALYGSGISSQAQISDEDGLLLYGGTKYRKSSEQEWKYCYFATVPDIRVDNTGKGVNMSVLLNKENPKEQCMESQMAYSFAVETGVSDGVEFDFYGGKYRYVRVPGSEDNMSVRVYKTMSQSFSAYDETGSEADWDIEVVLRMSLFSGVNLSGDIFAYWGGGYEQVGTCEIVSSSESLTGNPVKIYLEPDQTKWMKESSVSKAELGRFDFESVYRLIGEAVNLQDSYVKNRISYTGWKSEVGGTNGTGECCYCWSNNYWGTVRDTRYRIAVRFRGYAYYAACAPRSLYANYAASYQYRYYAGSAQALFRE